MLPSLALETMPVEDRPTNPGSPIEDDPYTGMTLAGRYRLQRRIATGGMGVVYRAEHVFLRRTVAVKIVHSLPAVPRSVEDMLGEARAASSIAHRNIVEVLDCGPLTERSAFLVMEYLEGSDLSHVLAGYRACAPERALRIALQLCGALGSAHSVGIVHRDVKPANIFLVEHDGGEVAKLLDFGVARPGPTTSSGISGPGRFVGTPGYAAPEQAVSGTCDHRADIYSLGAVLYEMLTGTPVFSGDSTKSIVTMQLLDDPEPPSRRAPHLGLPAELDRVVLRALARRPEDRYATMRQLATALRASEPQRA